MRRNNKKGFTIVELVIVIAVIGILAGVMIPVISGVVADAQKAADLSDAKTIYNEYVIAMAQDNKDAEDTVNLEFDEKYYFEVVKGVAVTNEDGTLKLTAKAKEGYCVGEYGVYAEHNGAADPATNCTNCGAAN